MDTPLFTAAHICLTALDPKEDAAAIAAWTQDSRYIPLVDDVPAHPMSAFQVKNWLEELLKEADEKRTTFWFAVRTPAEQFLLGIIGLDWVDWGNGAAYMSLTMRDTAEYSQPATQEAVMLMQRYVFHEIHMHRLSIRVPAYNTALIAALEAAGFVEEVRQREALHRFGRRWDGLEFGLLATEWKGA